MVVVVYGDTFDLEDPEFDKGGGGEPANFSIKLEDVKDMSLCLERSNVVANAAAEEATAEESVAEEAIEPNAVVPSCAKSPQLKEDEGLSQTLCPHSVDGVNNQPQLQLVPVSKTVSKLQLIPNHQAPVLQKLTSPPVITVLGSGGGPLTVLKTICVTQGVASGPQFSLVNNQQPLSVTNALGKTPTITLLNAPVTVIKVPATPPKQQNAEQQQQSQVEATNCTNISTSNVSTIVENRMHNVFVKNTAVNNNETSDAPQSHKFLTATSFPSTNVLAGISPMTGNTANGQRNKLKITSNVLLSSGTHIQPTSNLILNKPNILQQQQQQQQQQHQQRLVQRQKLLSPTSTNPPKMLNKSPQQQPNNVKPLTYNLKQVPTDKPCQQQSVRPLYPTHKNQLRAIPPTKTNNYKMQGGIKTLSPQHQPKNNVPGQVQRTGSGLKTIPPQRPPKLPNKLNYIGKHAVQAQKVKQHPNDGRYSRAQKLMGPQQAQSQLTYNSYGSPSPLIQSNKQVTFNQALTAEILETLGNKSAGPAVGYSTSRNFEILPSRYETITYATAEQSDQNMNQEKSKCGLDALSLICQAVLLDHNYNATMPPESPTRIVPMGVSNVSMSQVNGISSNSLLCSPGGGSATAGLGKAKYQSPSSSTLERKRTLSCPNPITFPPLLPGSMGGVNMRDDDAASDISDCSDRKIDTEGEETDTAPEAEAVANDEPYDHYSNSVTRCICGYLHDDGYMVECDQCKVWQHVQCVVKNKQIPDEYLCEKCNPLKPVDPQKARQVQQQWLRDRQLLPELKNFNKKDKLIKEQQVFKQKEIIASDTDSSDAENPPRNNVIKPRSSVVQRKKTDKIRQKKEPATTQKKQVKKRETRKMVRRKSKSQQVKNDDDNTDNFVTNQLPQLRQWIENYEEAVTNHYSPELRARISNIRGNGVTAAVQGEGNDVGAVAYDPAANKCRVHTQPLTDLKYLVASVKIPPNATVIELRGKYMLSTQHRSSGGGGNLNTRHHAQRPGPFLFFYRLQKENTEVCVDTRTYGNSARFIRRSCKPNAELRHCIEKGVLHLFIVTTAEVDKNVELTIKHESHDLAAIGTTQIACYCGTPSDCKLNKTSVKKNGDATTVEGPRKRRCRRMTSVSQAIDQETAIKKELLSPPIPRPSTPIQTPTEIPKVEEVKEESEDKIKIEIKKEEETTETAPEPLKLENFDRPSTPVSQPIKVDLPSPKKEEPEPVKEEKKATPTPPAVSTRRTSQHKGAAATAAPTPAPTTTAATTPSPAPEKAKSEDESSPPPTKQDKNKNKKLSREERKLQAILRAIEQMEKANQRKLEHKQAKATQRRDSEPSPNTKDEDKPNAAASTPTEQPKQKRRRRKGRARTTSQSQTTRRDRLNSGDSYFTSGDENMLSPNEGAMVKKPDDSTEAATPGKPDGGLLLALLANDDKKSEKTTPLIEHQHNIHHHLDSNSNSAHSSPETPLSLACSLVQAAVEPLESGFKFPKTKKGLMNEWLNKTPEAASLQQQIIGPLSPHSASPDVDLNTTVSAFFNNSTPTKIADSPPKGGSAKKRWLRQAINEDKCESPQESPPLSDMVSAPPKKRRLPRQSISNDEDSSMAPQTISASVGLQHQQEQLQTDDNCLDLGGGEHCDDVQAETKLESDVASEIKHDFLDCVVTQTTPSPLEQPTLVMDVAPIAHRPETLPFVMVDPRLRNHHPPLFSNSEHLIGTVEKTLSIFGFEEQKNDSNTPAKRKLSITEYRQRKKMNVGDTIDKQDDNSPIDSSMNDENNSSESFRSSVPQPRSRINSASNSSSPTSSDDESPTINELSAKAPVFNSEPTELERQRELQSLRLKKGFGWGEKALDVDALLNCDLRATSKPAETTTTTTVVPSLTIPTQLGSISPEIATSPILSPDDMSQDDQIEDDVPESPNIKISEPPLPLITDPVIETETIQSSSESTVKNEEPENRAPETVETDEKVDQSDAETDADDPSIKPHMFYTPDEEEYEVEQKDFRNVESINYVPPFNNPIYPSASYTSVIDEDARYEGRNPSPPPSHLDPLTEDA